AARGNNRRRGARAARGAIPLPGCASRKRGYQALVAALRLILNGSLVMGHSRSTQYPIAVVMCWYSFLSSSWKAEPFFSWTVARPLSHHFAVTGFTNRLICPSALLILARTAFCRSLMAGCACFTLRVHCQPCALSTPSMSV